MKFLPVADEADLCRRAFKDANAGTLTRHWFRKGLFCTTVDYSGEAEIQIQNILSNADGNDVALHLHLFRPLVYNEFWSQQLREAYGRLQKVFANNAAAKANRGACTPYLIDAYPHQKSFTELYRTLQHAADCPDCPWEPMKG